MLLLTYFTNLLGHITQIMSEEINLKKDIVKWQVALENSKVGVWDWDSVNNKVFYSKESKQILGYLDQEIGNDNTEWDSRVHPDDRERYFRDFKAHLEGELEYYENEHRILCKDGTYKWILDKGKVVERDANGKPIRIIGTHTDITTLKSHELQLKNSLDIITGQNFRLQNFTSIVSHNLRTHVGNLGVVLDFYEEAGNPDEKEEMIEHLKAISNSFKETLKDLDTVINIKTRDSIDENVDLKLSLLSVLDSFKLDIKNSGTKINIKSNAQPVLFLNKSYLESILHNFISNAIKYKDPSKASSIIDLTIDSNEDYATVLISDNGIGIDMEKYGNKLFDMYQTFHGTQREDSKGLGLYITKTQMDNLGGKIEMESKLGQGTAFTLSFPKK